MFTTVPFSVVGATWRLPDTYHSAGSGRGTATLKFYEDRDIVHIDEGLDFLGWRIQRHRKRGTSKHYVYVYPTKKALHAIMAKVKTRCRQNLNQPLETLLQQLNSMLRGWTAHFKYGCSNATFSYLRAFLWKRLVRWQELKHPRATWKQLRRRYSRGDGWPTDGDMVLFDPARVSAKRYYYRGTRIPTPWTAGA